MLKLNIELYKKLYLIRKSEEEIRRLYFEDQMKTPVHLSIGKEAIEAGVCFALKDSDQAFGSYRSHGLYLARTGDTDGFFAELYGKKTGIGQGRLGSMHLTAPASGLFGTSAIVASTIPVAIGAAYARKCKGRNSIAVVFFGDGATEEGAFWESMNVACLMKLPVLFVCEDNELAVHTSKSSRQGYDSITKIIKQFRCDVIEANTTDVEKVYNLASKARKLILAHQRPCFLKLRYYRYLEHVGINEDFDAGYRSRKEFLSWLKKDPISLQRKKLLSAGLTDGKLKAIERKIDFLISSSIESAKRAEFPASKELIGSLYCE